MLPPAHETLPTPLSIEQLVALLMPLHESVEDCPLVTLVGLAVNDPIAGAAALTVTVAVAVVVPPSPLAVRV